MIELKHPRHIMRQEGLENLSLKGKGDRGKQYIAYITSLCKWLTGFRRNNQKTTFTDFTKQEIVKSHNHLEKVLKLNYLELIQKTHYPSFVKY